jgi:hypothetical protein
MLECKTSLIPLSHNLNTLPPCLPNACPDISDADITVVFQCLVGSLTYFAICMHPDLAYTAMALEQYVEDNEFDFVCYQFVILMCFPLFYLLPLLAYIT